MKLKRQKSSRLLLLSTPDSATLGYSDILSITRKSKTFRSLKIKVAQSVN
jgi:hypothetical protein